MSITQFAAGKSADPTVSLSTASLTLTAPTSTLSHTAVASVPKEIAILPHHAQLKMIALTMSGRDNVASPMVKESA